MIMKEYLRLAEKGGTIKKKKLQDQKLNYTVQFLFIIIFNELIFIINIVKLNYMFTSLYYFWKITLLN